MKRATHAGRTHLTFTGVELLRKLAPLIPPPRVNLTRYHGVFAPGSKRRRSVVALARPRPSAPALPAPPAPSVGLAATPKVHGPYRLPWADLLKRVFGTDVLTCAKCGGPMQVVAYIHAKDAVRKILRHLGLPDTALPLHKARGPPQATFDW
jgi:hypothetical protein